MDHRPAGQPALRPSRHQSSALHPAPHAPGPAAAAGAGGAPAAAVGAVACVPLAVMSMITAGSTRGYNDGPAPLLHFRL